MPQSSREHRQVDSGVLPDNRPQYISFSEAKMHAIINDFSRPGDSANSQYRAQLDKMSLLVRNIISNAFHIYV